MEHEAGWPRSRQAAPLFGIHVQDNNQYGDAAHQNRAENIGVRVGDAIKRINDKKVSTLDEVAEAIRDTDHVKLEIRESASRGP